MTQIACLLYDGFTSLDLIGAYQVFTSWPDARVELVSDTRAVVIDDVGVMTYTPTATFADVAAPDVVVIPGSSRPFAVMEDRTRLDWLARVEPSARWMTSVCTGAGVLAAAGLLEGRRATTHWAFRDVLRGMGVDVVNERYVFDGKFVTGGGVTAGIDMALALTARELGGDVAKTVQLGMEYDPAPPFAGGTLETSEPDVVAAALAVLAAGLEDQSVSSSS